MTKFLYLHAGEGSRYAINRENIAYIHFLKGEGDPDESAEVYFVGGERLAVSSSACPELTAALESP